MARPLPQRALVLAAKARDKRAFEQLVTHYERPLLAFFIGLTSSSLESEELAQESFVRAWFELPKLRDPERFGAWLFGLARNCFREWARQRRKDRDFQTPDGERTAILERKALLHAEIFRIVQALPEPYREVLLLRYYSFGKTKDVAAALGRPLGTVTKQISRAHALVAQELKRLRGYTTLLSFFLRTGA